MRQRNWTFYKVILYVGLAVSLGLLSILSYMFLSRFRMYGWETIVQLTLLGALLQTVFYVMCIRLIHYFVANRIKPNLPFNVGYTVLLLLNICIAIGMLLILAFGFSEIFLQRNARPGREDYVALFIVGAYTFITIYISAASVVLRRYNHYQVTADEENLLDELGNSSVL